MRLIGEPKRHGKGVVVVLQKSVSVLALIQSRYGLLKLLQARVQVLLGLPPCGQVGLHHPPQREVVPNVCTLREKMTFQMSPIYAKFINFC